MTRDVFTTWKDGSNTLVAQMTPTTMIFMYDDEAVAKIDEDGNLCIKGKLFELDDPKHLMMVHDNDNRWMIWPNPVVYYEFERMAALLVQDPNSQTRSAYPACFWDKTNFYVWDKLETNVQSLPGELLRLTSFELPSFGIYTKAGIRGVLKSELTNEN